MIIRLAKLKFNNLAAKLLSMRARARVSFDRANFITQPHETRAKLLRNSANRGHLWTHPRSEVYELDLPARRSNFIEYTDTCHSRLFVMQPCERTQPIRTPLNASEVVGYDLDLPALQKQLSWTHTQTRTRHWKKQMIIIAVAVCNHTSCCCLLYIIIYKICLLNTLNFTQQTN